MTSESVSPFERWRRQNHFTYAELGEMLRTNLFTARRICLGEQLPAVAMMKRIRLVTNGEIDGNAIYDGASVAARNSQRAS